MNRTLRNGAVAVVVLLAVAGVWRAIPADSAPAPRAEASVPVSVLTVVAVSPQIEDWPQTLQASGPLAPWQEIVVGPETGGLRIAELRVDVGAEVRRGQLLARLADESLQADRRKQEAAVAHAKANLEQAMSNVQRTKLIEGSGALSAQKAEDYRIGEATARAVLASAEAELDSIKLKLAQTRIVAADDGFVSARSAVVGNVVNTGTELFRLVRQGRIEWRAELDARQIAAVRPGLGVHVTLPDGKTVDGRVRMVGPTLSTSTGRAIVYVSLPKGSPARAGMFASGGIEFDAQPALALPQSAIVMRDGKAYVFLIEAGDKVALRVIETGRRRGRQVEVLAGIDASARIVASGGAFLSDGVQVAVAAADPVRRVREDKP